MLQIIRDRFTGVLAVLIIATIGVALTITLVDTDTFTGITNFAARVDGEEIPLADYRQVVQQQILEQEQATRAELPAAQKLELQRNVLEGMVRNRVVARYVREAGYRVSDQRVVEHIRTLPGFQVNGQFSSDGYLAALASQGISATAFELERRAALQIEQLQNGLLESAFFTPAEYRRFMLLEGERRRAAFATLSPEQYLASITVDEADVKTYYESHPDRFESQESVSLDYVEAKASELPPAGEPTEAEIRTLYESAPERFETATQRRVRHILVAIDADTSEEAARQRAAEIRARLDRGEDFAALAREFSDDPGSAAAGGELGWAGPGTYVEPFEEALGSQRVGEVSQPVRTDFGFHIIELEEMREGARRTFEEVRGELAAELRSRGSQERFFELTESMDDAALENPGSLDAVARAAGLPVRRIEQFTRAGGEPLGAVRAVIDAAFSAPVLEDGENSPLIEVGEGRAIILRVVEHRPARLRPLDEVRPEVETLVRAEKAAAVVTERGTKIVSDARAGGDFAALVAAAGVNLMTPAEPLARNSPEAAPEVLAAIFRAHRPAAGTSVFDGVALPSGAFAVVRVDAVIPGNPEDIAREQRDARKMLLTRQVGVAEVTALAMDLRRDASVTVAPDLFEQQDGP
ncbi:MAG: peptidyl-prolyl cis-trans isomerase [Gammaproteobacteria bacterium]|nr:peptidyl-prolyl cis-trans isomerase [Gammaproteobacteria bacterium]